MRLSHGSPALSASFDDPNLVSVGGLVPIVALGQSCRLGDLVAEKLTLRAPGGVNARLKVSALVAGADQVSYLDLDDTMRETHGYAKQGAGYGYNQVKGLNALIATVSTPIAAPVIGAARLRKGAVKSARGAGKLLGEALGTARACGAGGPDRSGLVLARADSAFYCHAVIAAARRGGARFSITARIDAAVKKAIAAIGEDAWTPIRYPHAVWDDSQCWI